MDLFTIERLRMINSMLESGVLLFGAGSNGIWCLDYLKRNNVPVLAIIDNNLEIVGTHIEGLPVISYECYMNEYTKTPILITAKHAASEILQQHLDNQLMVPFDAWFIDRHREDYNKLCFNDARSYKVLKSLIKTMETADETNLYSIAEGNQYFALAPFFNVGSENYIDLGGYVGDTLERFLFAHNGAYKHIWIFEPGKKQLQALNSRLERLKREWALDGASISVIDGGVGRKNQLSYVSTHGNLLSMQIASSGDEQISVYGLDSYFDEKERITLIKADIEGAEYEMLLGAERIIREQKPKLALSVYHKPDDLIRIYNLLSKLELDYKFALRHHSTMLMDTTLYCW